jgi:hypothetical protein
VTPLNWLMRGLVGAGGAVLVFVAWPVAHSAWQAQKADVVMYQLRNGQPVELADLAAAFAALNRAVEIDPVAGRYLQRSELVTGAALTADTGVTVDQRIVWLRSAQSDLDIGLGNAPARGVGWARLASVRQGLNGSSRGVVDALLMSIDTAPMLRPIWPARLQLILDNWVSFTPQERQRIGDYVVMTWRRSSERRFFASIIRSPVDELLVRYFLRDEPKAQDELGYWIENVRTHGK